MENFIIEIFGDISGDTFSDIVHATRDLPDGAYVELQIASYGGELLPTISIIETLKRFHTHANIVGFACSAAAILALSCEECSMSENASMLLHSAWSDMADSDDPGIKRCNELQLQIIKNRCPEFDERLIETDTWLSAEDCLKLHLADNIYITDNINYKALCNKFVAKLQSVLFNKETNMEEEKINEVIEEVKEDAAEAPAEESMPEENHDLVEVIEKLTEELNALKARVVALEEIKEEKEEEKIEAECGDDPDRERINNIYKNIVAPQASVAIGAPKAASTRVVNKVDYKKFASFILD